MELGGKNMIYEELYKDFKELFPKDEEFFKKIEEEFSIDDTDGMHIVFGTVVTPFIQKIVNEDVEKTKKAFDYFEKMELDDNQEIGNVFECNVLEGIMCDENGIKAYIPFMKEKTLEAARHISQFFDVKPF